MAGISDDVENLRVNRADFMMALDEVFLGSRMIQITFTELMVRCNGSTDELHTFRL